MKRIPLEEAVPGLVLARPVRNAAGLVVVAADMSLDGSLITHLRRIGVPAVYVESARIEGAGKSLEDLEGELAARFRKVEGDAHLSRIREAIRCHFKSQSEPLP